MTKPGALTTPQLMAALRDRYAAPEYAFLEQVRSQTGYGNGATRTSDALAMSLWPSRGLELMGFEVKQDRADWLREKKEPAKAEEILRFCDRWWLVVGDASIVQEGELPPTWGLLVPRGKGLVIKVEAPLLPAEAMTRPMLAGILRNVETAKRGMVPSDEVGEVVAKAREEGRAAAGNDSKLACDLSMSKAEVARLNKMLADFREASGIDCLFPWSAGKVGEAVKLLLACGLSDAFEKVQHQQRYMLEEAKALGKRITKARAELPVGKGA